VLERNDAERLQALLAYSFALAYNWEDLKNGSKMGDKDYLLWCLSAEILAHQSPPFCVISSACPSAPESHPDPQIASEQAELS